MADGGNAEALKILGGEMAQVFSADLVLAEGRLVAFQTQVSQPTCDIHRRFLRLGDARGGVSPWWTDRVQGQKIWFCRKVGGSGPDRAALQNTSGPRPDDAIPLWAAGRPDHAAQSANFATEPFEVPQLASLSTIRLSNSRILASRLRSR